MLARQLASAAPDGEAGRTLQQIMGALEEAKSAIGTSEVFEPSMQPDGTLLLELGPKGQFSLQALDGGAQLLFFSPISGPKYYEWDSENLWWHSTQDGHQLVEIMVRELMHITSVYINL